MTFPPTQPAILRVFDWNGQERNYQGTVQDILEFRSKTQADGYSKAWDWLVENARYDNDEGEFKFEYDRADGGLPIFETIYDDPNSMNDWEASIL